MADPLLNLKPFKPGQSGNPGGIQGARKRINAAYLEALEKDFLEHGVQAIKDCRTQDPTAYVKAVAALQPKQVEHHRPLEEMEDADLLTALRALESFLVGKQDPPGDSDEGRGQTAH